MRMPKVCLGEKREGDSDAETHRREGRVKTEAEIGVMQPRAKEDWELLQAGSVLP